MKIALSKDCISCGETDYSEHFFFSCTKVRVIWNELESIISSKMGKKISLDLADVMVVVINKPNLNKKDILWINHIILVGKMVISKMKYGPKRYPLVILEQDLRLRNLF